MKRIGWINFAFVLLGGASSALGHAASANDVQARWTESLGVPSIYVERARRDVGEGHYGAAARYLHRAAALLDRRAERVYGLDRRRLDRDADALRLTARDVAAGAVTSRAQLDSVLDDTRRGLRER